MIDEIGIRLSNQTKPSIKSNKASGNKTMDLKELKNKYHHIYEESIQETVKDALATEKTALIRI